MTRTHRLAVAGALAAGLLPGTLIVVAPTAMAEPRPQHHAAGDSSAARSKAHIEYLERYSDRAEHPSRAAIEYEERIQNGSVSESPIEPVASEGFPWTVAGLSALGIAAAAASGVAVSRHGRQVPRSA
jgi:hypothetical protein